MKKFVDPYRPAGRFFYFLLSLLMAMAVSRTRAQTAPATTLVQDTVYSANGGDSRLAQEAHNYFGIKARTGRDTIALRTHEFVGGKEVTTVAHFARYPSLLECFRDRDEMIMTLPVYADARAVAGDPEAFIRALGRHWATDPRYAEKVLDLYHAYRFDLIDQKD